MNFPTLTPLKMDIGIYVKISRVYVISQKGFTIEQKTWLLRVYRGGKTTQLYSGIIS